MTQSDAALALGYALLPYQHAFVRMAQALQCYHAAAEAMGVPAMEADRILHEERTRGEAWHWRVTFDDMIARATRRLYDGEPDPIWIGIDRGRCYGLDAFRRELMQEYPQEPAEGPRPQDSARPRRHPSWPSLPRYRPSSGGF